MVQVIQMGPEYGKSAFEGLLEGLGSGLGDRYKKKQESKQVNALLSLVPEFTDDQRKAASNLNMEGAKAFITSATQRYKTDAKQKENDSFNAMMEKWFQGEGTNAQANNQPPPAPKTFEELGIQGDAVPQMQGLQQPQSEPNQLEQMISPQQMQPQAQGQPPQQQQLTPQETQIIRDIPRERLDQLTSDPVMMSQIANKKPAVATALASMNAANLQRDKFAATQAKPYMDKIEKKRDSVLGQRQALIQMDHALAKGDLNSMPNILAMLAEKNDYDPALFRTASSAQLQAANKTFLFEDIARLGGRPNQFIEKQMNDALPKALDDPKAKLIVNTGLHTGVDIREQEYDIYDRIVEQYANAGRGIPANISQLVHKQLKPYAQLKYDQLNTKLELIDKYMMDRGKQKGTLFEQKKAAKDGGLKEIIITDPSNKKNQFKVALPQALSAINDGWEAR